MNESCPPPEPPRLTKRERRENKIKMNAHKNLDPIRAVQRKRRIVKQNNIRKLLKSRR